jgi:hypothetical protein
MHRTGLPAPRPYNAAERYEELKGYRDSMERILAKMEPGDPHYWGAVNRMLIAENMITEHLLREMETRTKTE